MDSVVYDVIGHSRQNSVHMEICWRYRSWWNGVWVWLSCRYSGTYDTV